MIRKSLKRPRGAWFRRFGRGGRPAVIELSSVDSRWHVYRGVNDLGSFGDRESAIWLAKIYNSRST